MPNSRKSKIKNNGAGQREAGAQITPCDEMVSRFRTYVCLNLHFAFRLETTHPSHNKFMAIMLQPVELQWQPGAAIAAIDWQGSL